MSPEGTTEQYKQYTNISVTIIAHPKFTLHTLPQSTMCQCSNSSLKNENESENASRCVERGEKCRFNAQGWRTQAELKFKLQFYLFTSTSTSHHLTGDFVLCFVLPAVWDLRCGIWDLRWWNKLYLYPHSQLSIHKYRKYSMQKKRDKREREREREYVKLEQVKARQNPFQIFYMMHIVDVGCWLCRV